MDREKVIKATELLDDFFNEYRAVYDISPHEAWDIIKDTLKEQEAVKPEKEHSGSGVTWWNVCGNCKTAINPNDKYCHECGRAVKWE